MKVVDTRLPKLCFAKPGDVISIDNEIFMVCVMNIKAARAAPLLASNGLYSEERPLFLVNVASGVAVQMPHLSSRVEILHDATIVIGKTT